MTRNVKNKAGYTAVRCVPRRDRHIYTRPIPAPHSSFLPLPPLDIPCMPLRGRNHAFSRFRKKTVTDGRIDGQTLLYFLKQTYIASCVIQVFISSELDARRIINMISYMYVEVRITHGDTQIEGCKACNYHKMKQGRVPVTICRLNLLGVVIFWGNILESSRFASTAGMP